MGAIAQEYIGKSAFVLVLAVGLENDIFPKDQRCRRLLRSGAEGLTFLRAVDATEADAFRMSFGLRLLSYRRRQLLSRSH